MLLKKSEKILIIVFLLFTIFVFLCLFFGVADFKNTGGIIESLFLLFPVLLMILHSFVVLSPKRGIMFILIGIVIGTVMEYFGLKDGVIFGGEYVYNMAFPKLFTVPLPVVFFWPVFIYTSYSLTNAVYLSFKNSKPNYLNKNWLLTVILVICDGLTVTAIDLFMDPLQVIKGNWSWAGGGLYFGIPIGNFIGWFIVGVIVSGIFRFFEYCYPKSEESVNKVIYLIPVFGYATLSIFFTVTALKLLMVNLAIFGFLITMTPIVIGIYLFTKKHIKQLSFFK